MDEWFDLIDELPVLKKELREVDYLKKIYTRDSGQVTSDSNGKSVRIKKQAGKEIAYIYYVINKKLFAGYGSEAKRNNVIKERLGLDITWQPDEEILKAIDLLKTDNKTIQQRLVDTLRSNLETNLELFKSVQENSKKVLEFLQREVDELTTEEISERKILIDSAKQDFKLVLSFINDLATSFEKLDTLEVKLKQSERQQGKEISQLETDGKPYMKTARRILN